jgi:type II secretory pathway pseudopilin PulG
MRRRSPQRASMLVAALLLFSILLALGLGLMSSQSARMKVAQSEAKALQAKQLCLAAWDDVRLKLGKDILFPLSVDTQTFFAYSEDVYVPGPSGEEYFGSYTVVVDTSLESVVPENPTEGAENDVNIPQGIYQVTCIGKVGPRTAEPEAERVMYYEIVMTDPDDAGNTFKVIRVEDRGSL